MKKIISILIILISLNTYAQDKEQEIKELQFNYLSFLKSEGYVGSIDEDGDIKFKFEGDTYYIWPSTSNFFTLKRYLTNNDEGCSNKIKAIVKATNGKYKATSVGILGENCNLIKIEIESLLANPEDYKLIFDRCINIIRLQRDLISDEYEKYQ
tara:strand:- start:2047 stop:2508 length:462 start_codon:yes stop_codon:yes gene_type:complete